MKFILNRLLLIMRHDHRSCTSNYFESGKWAKLGRTRDCIKTFIDTKTSRLVLSFGEREHERALKEEDSRVLLYGYCRSGLDTDPRPRIYQSISKK